MLTTVCMKLRLLLIMLTALQMEFLQSPLIMVSYCHTIGYTPVKLIKLFLEYRCHHRRCNCCYHSSACCGSCSDCHLLVIVSRLTTLNLICFLLCTCRRRRYSVTDKKKFDISLQHPPIFTACSTWLNKPDDVESINLNSKWA